MGQETSSVTQKNVFSADCARERSIANRVPFVLGVVRIKIEDAIRSGRTETWIKPCKDGIEEEVFKSAFYDVVDALRGAGYELVSREDHSNLGIFWGRGRVE